MLKNYPPGSYFNSGSEKKKQIKPQIVNRPKNKLMIQIFGHCLEDYAPNIRLNNRKKKHNFGSPFR